MDSLDGGEILPIDNLSERLVTPLLEQALEAISEALGELFVKALRFFT